MCELSLQLLPIVGHRWAKQLHWSVRLHLYVRFARVFQLFWKFSVVIYMIVVVNSVQKGGCRLPGNHSLSRSYFPVQSTFLCFNVPNKEGEHSVAGWTILHDLSSDRAVLWTFPTFTSKVGWGCKQIWTWRIIPSEFSANSCPANS